MPEWPECESNRRRLEACLNRTIEDVRLGNDVAHVDLPDAAARERLIGRQFTEARRHGKVIFAGSKSGPWIVVHLGMTGSIRPFEADAPMPDYARLVIAFEGDRRLAFRCPRKFGSVGVIDDPDAYVAEQGLGPDAMAMDRAAFRGVIGGTGGAIKGALLDQSKIAGLGNLWSDEALFRTGTAPDARADALPTERIDAIYDAMRAVIGAVDDTGADYGKLPRDWLIAHRDTGAECRRCGGRIAKARVSGRSAYYCADHQGLSR